MVIAQSGLRAVSTFRGKVVELRPLVRLGERLRPLCLPLFIRVAKIHSTREKSEDDSRDQGVLGTMAGDIMGTPAYMAPEQVRDSADVDGRADIYALGVFMRSIFAGVIPSPKTRPGFCSVSRRTGSHTTWHKQRDMADWRRSFTHTVCFAAHVTNPAAGSWLRPRKRKKHENLRALS